MVALYHRTRGAGDTVVLLHGLFGSADNVGMLARGLEDRYQVVSFDLRDHGRSPHSDTLDYRTMALDILKAVDDLAIEKFHIFGHSMGGKVAMALSGLIPERITSLMVGDIAPVSYAHHHEQVLKAQKMLSVMAPAPDRVQAEETVKPFIDDPMVRHFILTNWRRHDGGWGWRHNLDLIIRDYDKISAAPAKGKPYEGPVLFLKGSLSPYIKEEHKEAVLSWYPSARLKTLEGTGHWFHAEKTDMTLRIVSDFLQSA